MQEKRRLDTVLRSAIMVFGIIASVHLLCGCSIVELANPNEVVSHPLGTESIKLGMTKEQVNSLWGKPDEVRTIENKEKWQGTREMWVYRSQFGSIPVDAGYLSNTKKLYFDGNNLVEISN